MNRYFWPDMPAGRRPAESKRPVKMARPYQARRVSMVTKGGREVFAGEKWKNYAAEALLKEAGRLGIKILTFVFLPDRLELLA